MTPEYHAEFFLMDREHSTGHAPAELSERLNNHAKTGWTLEQMQPVSIGFLLVFKRPG